MARTFGVEQRGRDAIVKVSVRHLHSVSVGRHGGGVSTSNG